MELKKLLYAVDLEDAPHPAIEHVKMVASLTGASVSIVYVLPSETVYESNYLSGEGQPNRIAPTKPCWKDGTLPEHELPGSVDDCRVPHGEDFGRSRQIRPQERHRLHRRRRAWPDRVPAAVRRVVATEVVKRPLTPYPSSAPDIDGTPPALSRQARKSITRFGTPAWREVFSCGKACPEYVPPRLQDGLTRTSRRCNRKQSMRNAHGRHF